MLPSPTNAQPSQAPATSAPVVRNTAHTVQLASSARPRHARSRLPFDRNERFGIPIPSHRLRAGLMVLLELGVVRNDLLQDWQASLPADTLNFIMINIPTTDTPDFVRFIEERNLLTRSCSR